MAQRLLPNERAWQGAAAVGCGGELCATDLSDEDGCPAGSGRVPTERAAPGTALLRGQQRMYSHSSRLFALHSFSSCSPLSPL